MPSPSDLDVSALVPGLCADPEYRCLPDGDFHRELSFHHLATGPTRYRKRTFMSGVTNLSPDRCAWRRFSDKAWAIRAP